nr:hypothetical protein Iba_chr02cCG9870 [Ipomoea batatas]
MASESDEGLSNANSAWIAGFSPERKQSNNASGCRLIRSNCGLLAQLEESSAVIHSNGLEPSKVDISQRGGRGCAMFVVWLGTYVVIRAGDGGMGEAMEVDATAWVSWVIRTASYAIAVLMTSVRAWFCVAMARRRPAARSIGEGERRREASVGSVRRWWRAALAMAGVRRRGDLFGG